MKDFSILVGYLFGLGLMVAGLVKGNVIYLALGALLVNSARGEDANR